MSTVIAGEGTFKSAGLQIFFRSWRPSLAPRAAVVIVPGFNSHSAYYAWTAHELIADRLAVYALDLRGRGKSDGERSTSRRSTTTSATSRIAWRG